MASKLLLTALLAGAVLAKTDLNGCVSFQTIVTVPNRPDVYPYGSLIWYVPGSGEVCEFLDCGGGRAPPKTTVPGCAAYKGTETYSPMFIDPKTLGHAPQTDAATSAAVTQSPAVTTKSPSASAVASVIEAGSSSAPVLTSVSTLTQTGSLVESLLTTTTATVGKTTAAPAPASEGSSSHKASSASNGAASSPAPTPSSVSTAAAGAMPTAGGMLALAAGAAVYAGMV